MTKYYSLRILSLLILCPSMPYSSDIERDCLRELSALKKTEERADRNSNRNAFEELKKQINIITAKGCWKYKKPSQEEIERQTKYDEKTTPRMEGSNTSFNSNSNNPTHTQLMDANGKFGCMPYTFLGQKTIALYLATDRYGTFAINGAARNIANKMGWKDGKNYFTSEELALMIQGMLGKCKLALDFH